MLYLLSWSGRGYLVFVLLIAAVLLGCGVAALIGRAEILWFGLAWIIAGAICLVLGKKWNKPVVIHQFCGLAMETWGFIFAGIGVFLAIPGIEGLRYGM